MCQKLPDTNLYKCYHLLLHSLGCLASTMLQLINAALDISAIFEAREDVVTRHTRFTSKASVTALLKGIEEAATQLGATSQRRGPTK